MSPDPIVKVSDANREWLIRQLYAIGYVRDGCVSADKAVVVMLKWPTSHIYVNSSRGRLLIGCASGVVNGFALVNSPAHMIAYLKVKKMIKIAPKSDAILEEFATDPNIF